MYYKFKASCGHWIKTKYLPPDGETTICEDCSEKMRQAFKPIEERQIKEQMK